MGAWKNPRRRWWFAPALWLARTVALVLLILTVYLITRSWWAVHFTRGLPWELEDAFPQAVPVTSDGAGNFWIVDIHPETGAWGAVYFSCHDPSVVAWGFSSLAEFLHDFFHDYRLGVKHSRRHRVEDDCGRVSRLPTVAEARQDADPVLRKALADADDRELVADLRNPGVLGEFPYGLETEFRRPGAEPIWILSRL